MTDATATRTWFDQRTRFDWTADSLAAEIVDYEAAVGRDVDWRRFEILDGLLIITPSRPLWHSWAINQLASALRDQVPRDLVALGAFTIDLHPSYPITDGTVVPRRTLTSDQTMAAPQDVLLATEIEWPRSITADRITKPAQYAAAGIPHYWRIETEPWRLHTYRRDGTQYVRTGTWDDVVRVDVPFPIEIDVRALLLD